MNKKGFTLVELLAVIAILAILVIMALPAVLKMFTQARIDTFNNELNTIIRTTRQQYLLSGGQAATYSKDSNPLSLTGNSELNYCITINGQGQIVELKATNGSYKYESNGIVSETSSSDVEVVGSGFDTNCLGIVTPLNAEYVIRQNAGSITIGDEITIGTEHFNIISTSSTETVLLAKYNLYVGDIYTSNNGGSNWTRLKSLGLSDEGYGLQKETSRGFDSSTSYHEGIVAFSGKGYWDSAECVSNGRSGSTCSGAGGLLSPYNNVANDIGKTWPYVEPYPYVYESAMSSVAPQYTRYNSFSGYAQDNGYTIAYYVEFYVNKIKEMSGTQAINGRLLSYEEANNLSENLKSDYSYLLGSAYSNNNLWCIFKGNIVNSCVHWNAIYEGVRPVIVVPTNSMPN